MSNLLISQFQAKIRRFGWWRTALYSLEFAVQPIYRAAWTRPVRKSYSQRYEDVEVDDLLGRPAEGFYVDVGANHPSTLSNTRRFYERGWSGINIEPNPARIPLFRQQRPRDVTLNCGVGEGEGELTFYALEPDTLSTFDAERAAELRRAGAELQSTIPVPIRSLASILAEFRPGGAIDFMSVDTEGFDLQVLRSNDWRRWRPRVICVEAAEAEREESCHALLVAHGYELRRVIRNFGNNLNSLYEDGSRTVR